MRFGSHVDPPNRFEKLHVEAGYEHWKMGVRSPIQTIHGAKSSTSQMTHSRL